MAKRDNCLFILVIRTGYRISELLSLRVQDVQQHGKIVDKVAVARKAMKGGKAGKATGRTVANRVYDKLNHDLVKTHRALGHASVASTGSYSSFREEEIDAAILAA
jgi:hypothetical protein